MGADHVPADQPAAGRCRAGGPMTVHVMQAGVLGCCPAPAQLSVERRGGT